MVVDDDVRALDRIRRDLANAGVTVSIVDSAENLEARIANLAPDLVLIDVLMPELSGPRLSALLRAHAKGPRRIVLLSPVPPRFLRSVVDTSGASGIVQVGKGSIAEQLLAIAEKNGANPPERGPLTRPATGASGTHRMGLRRATDPRELLFVRAVKRR